MPGHPFPSSNHELASPAINSWILAVIDFGARRGRLLSMSVVTGLVSIIGTIGYLTGNRYSLYSFYLLPIILSALWFGWRWGCAVSVISIVVRVSGDLAHGDKEMNLSIFWNRMGHLSIYLVLVGVLHALISLQRQLERRVQQRTAALAQAVRSRDELQRQLFDTGRRERSSIGRELHDGLGQHLTATSLTAKMLSSELEAEGHPSATDAKTIVRMTQEGIAQTRQLARGLLLAAIEPEELTAELEELCGELQKEHGISCRFIRRGDIRGLDVERASHLYYIAHEAMLNALRHARATLIEVGLESRRELLELVVTDNGSGPPSPEANLPGMGLRIMAHRAELIGGQFAIDPGPGSGTRVTCTLQLSPAGAAL